MSVLVRNLILTVLALGSAVYALHLGRNDYALAALTFTSGLWMHSGRKEPGDPGLSVLIPACCMAALALGACDAGWAYHWPGEARGLEVSAKHAPLYGPQSKLLADSIEMLPAAAPTYTASRGGIHVLNTDGLFYTQDANGLLIKLHAAQSYRTSANCAGLAAPVNGDVCYDTALGLFRNYSGGWTSAPLNDALLVHLAGVETITGVKTFNAAPVFAAGLTASGSTANNFGGGTGDFTLSTGNVAWSGAAGKQVLLTQGVATTASPYILKLIGGAHTTLTASTEANDIFASLARTVQFATGALTNQRAVYITSPTYGFVGASTIADAATVAISAAPTAGTNATITNAHALLVEAGRTTLKGALTVTGAASSIVASSAALTLTAGATSVWSNSSGDLRVDTAAVLNLGTTAATSTNLGRSGQVTNVLGTVQINTAPTVATFFKTCTITSAAAATPVNCLSAADVPAALSAKLGKWHLYINGATPWATTATCVIEDTAGTDLVSIAVAAMTANAFVGDHSANVTPAAAYRLGTGGAVDLGLQISCNANGTGSDAVFVLMGTVQ